MSLGSWDPTAGSEESDLQLTDALLSRLIDYSQQDQLDNIATLLEDSLSLARIMQIEHTRWQQAAESLDAEQIVHLIRFLAVAENLPGWEAGASSPVIPLAKVLRKQGRRLDKPFLQWLREVNENRFLPYGPL